VTDDGERLCHVAKMPSRDPFFALAPELRLHLSEDDGALVVSSREVARVFFHRKHRRVLRKIMRDIWDMPMQPNYEDEYRLRDDGTVDITSTGLTSVLNHWGFHNKNKRLREFRDRYVKLIVGATKEIEAETGKSPIRNGVSLFFPDLHWRYFTEDGLMCCEECRMPPRVWGPMVRDELWTAIAHKDAFLCLDWIEHRLGRALTQADLKFPQPLLW